MRRRSGRVRAALRRIWPQTLAGRMLATQLLIVSIVFVAVGALSVAQQGAGVTDREVRRARQVAEQVTQEPGVRQVLGPQGEAWMSQAQAALESARTLSASDGVYLARTVDGSVVAAAADDPVRRLPRTEAFEGSSWLGGEGDDDDPTTIMAMAPVIVPGEFEPVGVVAVTRPSPSAWDDLATITPNLLTYLGLAGVIGVVGSLLLARRVKRQTLGLEPREIAGLVEQREAVLHGIKEGLLAVDLTGRVTLINDEAATLLSIPQAGAVGHSLSELGADRPLLALFPSRRLRSGPTVSVADEPEVPSVDRAMLVRGRLVTANVMPVRQQGRLVGHVATLRDRTELLELQRDLDVTRATTDSLRAQAHEFSNRMHVVAGLIALEEYDDVTDYIRHITADEAELTARVGTAVADPAVAAMLMAKSRQAAERGITLDLDDESRLARLDGDLSTDLNTILGNLVDNALEAVPDMSGRVRVAVSGPDGGSVRLVVHDNGPGVPADDMGTLFVRGWSTKDSEPGSSRGIGLALVRMVCTKRGGEVSVSNDDGAVFTVSLPTG
ncbi:sensor histidine kinase [Knoellia locipacati]|uniref:sensor histidine kinase n=1 Tax=Knoellia locipacati TaxID=882824 RepID=UPI001C9A8CA4|nr:ATP-binding protein [Knoellia locipacati]